MSANVWESAHINQPINRVWPLIRSMDFVYNPRVQSTRTGPDRKPPTTPWSVGDIGTVNYVDGTAQELRLTELSDSKFSISYEIVSSTPEINYSGVNHHISLRRVTSTNTTFISWEAFFSKDASASVLGDAKLKITDAFAALAAEAAKEYSFYSTAAEVVKSANIAGRVFVVTGGNSGIGYEAVRVLASAGAKVVFTARDQKKIDETVAELKKGQPNANVSGMQCSLESLKSVKAFTEAYIKTGLPLHVLICNAGVMACPPSVTDDKFELQLGVNHIAHHYLTTQLLPVLKKSAPARVVVLSSGAHRRHNINWDDMNWTKNYDPWFAYGQSKTANILFAKQLNLLLKGSGVVANALHPGVIATNLGRHLSGGMNSVATATPAKPAGDSKDNKSDVKAAPAPAGTGTATNPVTFIPRMKSTEQGASTTILVAVHPKYSTTENGGLYFSDCNPIPPLPYAADMAAAERLWKWTEAEIARVTK